MNLPKPTNEWYSGADQGAGLVDQRKVKEMEMNREWNGTTDCWTFERSHATSLVPRLSPRVNDPTFLYCKRQKAGRGAGTRLPCHYICVGQ